MSPSLIGRCGGGGGSISKFCGGYTQAAPLVIPTGGAGYLPVDTLYGGDAALDLSTPTAPTVTKTGNWFIGGGVYYLNASAVGTEWGFQIEATDNGTGLFFHDGAYQIVGAAASSVPLYGGLAVWLESGSPVGVYIYNFSLDDGSGSMPFSVLATQAGVEATFLGGP